MEKTVEWKLIKEYPNYEVSSMGQIRNIKTQRILKQTPCTNGGLQVTFCMRGMKSINKTVSKIVAQYFIENPNKLQRVKRRTNDLTDNSVANLYFD